MASVVGICNRALSKIGDEIGITSINDDLKPARYCKLLYADTRDYVLRSYPWRFALKQWRLAPIEEKPVFGFENAFQLPAECLSVWRPENPDDNYGVYGRTVHANGIVFGFVGCARIEDPTLFDPMFADALSLRLAYELVPALAGDMNLKNFLMQEFELRVKEARRASAIESPRAVFEMKPDWVTAHYGA